MCEEVMALFNRPGLYLNYAFELFMGSFEARVQEVKVSASWERTSQKTQVNMMRYRERPGRRKGKVVREVFVRKCRAAKVDLVMSRHFNFDNSAGASHASVCDRLVCVMYRWIFLEAGIFLASKLLNSKAL